MKPILYAALAVALLAGCAKNVNEPVDNEINVEFEIAEKVAFGGDTKALKTGWETGDMIRVAFSDDSEGLGNTFPLLTENAYTVSFFRQNDGTWRVGKNNLKDSNLQDLNGYGKYKAVYYPGGVNFGTSDAFGTRLKDYAGGEYLVAEGDYEVSGSTMKIIGVIDMQRPAGLMQLSVKNLAAEDIVDGNKWTLTVERMTSGDPLTKLVHLRDGGLELDSQVNVLRNSNHLSEATGVVYGSDVSFCFYVEEGSNVNSINAFVFTLSNGAMTYTYSKIVSGGLVAGTAYLLPSLAHQKEVGGELQYVWVEQ